MKWPGDILYMTLATATAALFLVVLLMEMK